MRRISIAAMMVGVLLSFGANAQTVTTEQYRHPKTDKDLNFNKSYFVGLKDGLIAYNISTANKLFCMPGALATLTFEQANDILLRWANKKRIDSDMLPVGLALLYGLKETFPCPK